MREFSAQSHGFALFMNAASSALKIAGNSPTTAVQGRLIPGAT